MSEGIEASAHVFMTCLARFHSDLIMKKIYLWLT